MLQKLLFLAHLGLYVPTVSGKFCVISVEACVDLSFFFEFRVLGLLGDRYGGFCAN